MARPTRKQIRKRLMDAQGIGPKLADRIVRKYGLDTPAALTTDPEQVAKEISGVSKRRAEAAAAMMQQMLVEAEAENARPTANERSGGAELHPAANRAADGPVRHTSETVDRGSSRARLLPMDEVHDEMLRRWDEVHQKRMKADDVFERHKEALLRQPNVCGVHVGFRRVQNEDGKSMITADLECCLRVHVREKFALDAPHFSDPRLARLLPAEIEGVGVDVLQRSYTTLDEDAGHEGDASTQEGEPANADSPISAMEASTTSAYEATIVGGIEIANVLAPGNAGTLGGIVYKGARRHFITNRHVVGDHTGDPGQRLVQQPADGRTPDGSSAVIGEVIDSAIPDGVDETRIDCAIIRPVSTSRSISRRIKDIGPPHSFFKSSLTWPDVHRTWAFKSGAQTQLTGGIVQSVNAAVNVNGTQMFGQILVESAAAEPILKPGDSGSLLLTQAEDRSAFYVVGLIHAKTLDRNAMVATHIDEIETRFGIKVSLFRPTA